MFTPTFIIQKEKNKGMTKSKTNCPECPYVQERQSVKKGKYTWSINDQVDCDTENIVYLIQCNKENCQINIYVGETERKARERISEHRGYIYRKEKIFATGEHFNQPGHSLANMKFTILEAVKKKNPLYRKEREIHHISENRILFIKE